MSVLNRTLDLSERMAFNANFGTQVDTLEDAVAFLRAHYPHALRSAIDIFEPMDEIEDPSEPEEYSIAG